MTEAFRDPVPRLSVVVPVRNDRENLRLGLEALLAAGAGEVIVVDDASSDGSAEVARGLGATVIALPARVGPGMARNRGALVARGEILVFVDADVCVHRDTLERIAAAFEADPSLAALFGSYDDQPSAPRLLSQYKNLFHHYVHQTGETEAATFWAGCGAIRRAVFLESGGFSRAYGRPSIEDIELGMRLCRSGRRIVLEKDVQATHRKRWTFAGLIRSDLFDRAVPWSRLILHERNLPDTLNLRLSQRLAAALGCTAAAALGVLAWQRPPLLGALFVWYAGIVLADGLSARRARLATGLLTLLAAGVAVVTILSLRLATLPVLLPLLVMVLLNHDFYAFFIKKRGLPFTLGLVLPMHVLYYVYSVLGLGLAVAERLLAGFRRSKNDGALERNALGPRDGTGGKVERL
jgi:GT2 family glycosyltransferase